MLHTICGVTHFCLVVYYPCCGDVDINQSEMYVATEIMQVKIG